MDVSLEKDMKGDPEIISLCKDREIAKDFYRAICNMQWKKNNIPEDEQIIQKLQGYDPGVWSCTWRYAGGIISDIRNDNYKTAEDYMSFYCSGEEGYVSEIVEDNFNRLGWIKYPYEDDNE